MIGESDQFLSQVLVVVLVLELTTLKRALGGTQAVPSDLIPVRQLHQHHLITQAATSGGNVVLTRH